MKITILIMTVCLLQVSALTKAQISIDAKQESLREVLKKISQQSGYDFIYSVSDFKDAKPVDLKLNNVSLDLALRAAFYSQPLIYEVSDQTVMVRKKEEKSYIQTVIDRFQAIDVRGRILDEKNQPLPGATVSVKGKEGEGVKSDEKGNFYIKGVDERATLVISFVGYMKKEIMAKEDVGIVSLEMEDNSLEQVQVIAYGTVSKKYSTTNVGTVTAEEIARQPINNPLLALQARTPGVFIEQTTGVSGASVNVTIQGINSFRPDGRAPFYVIDGVPYSAEFTSASLNNNGVANGGKGGSTFNFINPADIESISVLKDADATAIYGSRAANGAILITTKKGKAGRTKVDVSFRQGRGKIAHKLDFLNTKEYLEMRKEGYKNSKFPLPTAPESGNYDLTVWDQNKYTDWQKVLVGGTAQFTDMQASVSGGSANTQFLMGYGYNRQTTVYPNGQADQKGNVHVNINHSSTDNKFKAMLNASYLKDKNELNSTDLMYEAVTLAPNAPDLYNSDGTINWGPLSDNPNRYSFTNPLAYTLQPYTGNTNNLTANNSISYEVFSGLQLKATMGYSNLEANETQLNPITSIRPDRANKVRSASFLEKSITSWIIEPQITYNKSTRFGVFDLLLGSTLQETLTDVFQQTGKNYVNDSQLGNLQAAPTIIIDNVIKSLYRYNAVFARANYRLQDKYILNLTARRDGSSRFGDENKFHTFYAAGGAWLFADEEFTKSLTPWMSTGKLRVNYGTTGNDQISDYSYESLLDVYQVDQAYQGLISLYPTRISNPFLQWEETRKLNIGLDLGFFKDRFEFNINYFRNRSSNQLLERPLPTVTGFGGLTKNVPATIQNTGLEILLSSEIIRTSNFSWHPTINFTNPKNKLAKYSGLEGSADASSFFIGHPVNVVTRFKSAGVNAQTGLYEFINRKGEKTYSPSYSEDKIVLIDPNPEWYGGISNSLRYKNFQLDFLIQAVKQKAENYRFGNLPGSNINQPRSVLDRWQKDGDQSPIQMFDSGLNDYRPLLGYLYASQSDANYGDASYIRLKNVALSYTLKDEWLQKAHINSASIFCQGQNLFTITNFKGSDPETKASTILPPLRFFTIGANLTF